MKKSLFAAAVIVLVGLVINSMLGGFKDVDVQLVQVDNYRIYGKSFSGRYDSDELENLIEQVRKMALDGTLAGDLVIVNYMNERQEKRGDVEQFIGVLTSDGKPRTELPGFESRVIITSQAMEAQIDIAKLIMPSPEKVKNKANALADELGLSLMKLTIEQYADKKLIIRFPVN
jgi:hypothetical protein